MSFSSLRTDRWFPGAASSTASSTDSPASSASESPSSPSSIPLPSVLPTRSAAPSTFPAFNASRIPKMNQNKYVKTFKKCFKKPDKTVLKYPIQSLTYHTAIKILFYFVAQSFPVIGWSVVAFSSALYERVVILHIKDYSKAITKVFKEALKYIGDKWRKTPSSSPSPSSRSVPFEEREEDDDDDYRAALSGGAGARSSDSSRISEIDE